jgi:hypothetical protein
MNLNFVTLLDKLNMDTYGFRYIIILSIVYLFFSYLYVSYYDIVLAFPKTIKDINIMSMGKLFPIFLLNLVSVLSYIIYCRNMKDEKKANRLAGHFILMPLYIAIFYVCFRVITAFC